MKRIVADPTKCLACRTCELACALAHADTDDLIEAIFQRAAKPRIYIESAGKLAVPLQCRHCQDAPCATVCPSGALSRPSKKAPVHVDQNKCIGCGYCVEACPFGVILLGQFSATDGTSDRRAVIKCDLCARRRAKGQEPACVASCPVGALWLEEAADVAKRTRLLTAARAVAAAATDGESQGSSDPEGLRCRTR